MTAQTGAPADLVQRRALAVVDEALRGFRCVVVHGPRQSGKTTLARLIASRPGAVFHTLDDAPEREAASADPDGYVAAGATPLVVDEIQRVGDPLVLAIKSAVDKDRRPGQFLLTGSTNFLTVPTISETLAGRTDIVELWPLAQCEIENSPGDFIDRALTTGTEGLIGRRVDALSRPGYFEAICRGGFPEVQAMSQRTRRRWFARYVDTVLDREVEVVADIRRREALDAMVRLMAATTAQELVVSKLANRLGITRETAESYEPWLERVFLVTRVPAWGRGLTTKIIRRPKVYMVDTGLAAALVGRDAAALARPTEPVAGPLLESLAASELLRQLTWSDVEARLHHLRDSDGHEVDLVLEAIDGRVVGIEVKTSANPRADDFRGLAFLRDRLDQAGVPFVGGVVVHTGARRSSFGDRLAAIPLSDLWR